MESETSVDDVMSDEMIQQLRQWQQEQKNRLIEQQQQQRQLLIEKQKKLLSMINTCEVTNLSESTPEPEESTCYLDNENGQFSPAKASPHSPTNVDEVPLKKPRAVRSFQQLLENSINQNSVKKDQPVPSQEPGQGKKFPFLKRGQGISRFGVISKPKIVKATSVATSQKEDKENRTPAQSCPSLKQSLKNSEKSHPIPRKMEPEVNTKSAVDEPLQHVPSSQQIVPYQPPRTEEPLREANASRNEEELAVFELIERFTNINSSFSSNSSLIGQLIDKGINQLPSPTKFMSFLSRNKQPDLSSHGNQKTTSGSEPKIGKPARHVRFAETIDEEEQYKNPTEVQGPWLADITEEDLSISQPSPFVSNTIRQTQPRQSSTSAVQDRIDLDETPTSPIGFPDYQKLFGNPVRSLWSREELVSPTQPADRFPKPEDSQNNNSDPIYDQIKAAAALPLSLPIEDPQVVYQTSLLRSRLTSLEREIANYRRETDSLRRARKEHDESKQKLEQEQEKFKRYTENEKRRLQLLYSEEQKRVRAEQIKDLPQLKENEAELSRLREELRNAKEEHRQKENKWMANQTKVQEKIRALEIRNRELSESLEKARTEEQNLRRRLNASLRPGALGKSTKAEKTNSLVAEEKAPSSQPSSPQIQSTPNAEIADESSSHIQKDPAKLKDVTNLKHDKNDNMKTLSSPATGTASHAVLPDGTKLILYANGNRKEIWPDGKGIQVIYYNGDIKQKLADGSVIYTYADSGTKHTTKPDGTDILEFSSGQIETTYPDGRSQVQYPGGAVKMKYPDGREDSQLPDGTKLWTDGKGHGVMTFPSGIKEIYTPICKRREYPDGTVKTVYEDGRSETRYANGRIRVKDKDGKIITDTGEVQIPK